MKSPKIILTGLTFVLGTILVVSCGGLNSDAEREEVIDRMLALGVSADPVVALIPADDTTRTPVTLTIYAAVPTGEKVSVQNYVPTSTGFGVALSAADVQVDSSTESYTAYNGFQLYTVKANVQLPVASKFGGQTAIATVTPTPTPGTTTDTTTTTTTGTGFPQSVSYGFSLVGTSRTENITGSFDAARTGAAALAYTAPTVTIDDVTDGQAISSANVPISTTATMPVSTEALLGWFVSGGTVLSRREKSTFWSPGASGNYTLVSTARGAVSKSFAIKIVNVKVN